MAGFMNPDPRIIADAVEWRNPSLGGGTTIRVPSRRVPAVEIHDMMRS